MWKLFKAVKVKNQVTPYEQYIIAWITYKFNEQLNIT